MQTINLTPNYQSNWEVCVCPFWPWRKLPNLFDAFGDNFFRNFSLFIKISLSYGRLKNSWFFLLFLQKEFRFFLTSLCHSRPDKNRWKAEQNWVKAKQMAIFSCFDKNSPVFFDRKTTLAGDESSNCQRSKKVVSTFFYQYDPTRGSQVSSTNNLTVFRRTCLLSLRLEMSYSGA